MVQAAEDVTVKSPLEMSDEELMNLDPSTLDQFDQPQPAEATGGEAPEVAEAGEAVEEDEQEEVETPEQPAASLEEEEQEEVVDAPAQVVEPEGKQEEEATPEAEVASGKELDYKAEYEKLLKPFKANGRDIQVGSVDDAIALMQMGANYNKKMAALKPNMKLLKMLENIRNYLKNL